MSTFQSLRALRSLARQSPWVLIAVALHLVVIAGAAIFYTANHAADEELRPIEVGVAPPRALVESLPPVPEFVRHEIPDQDQSSLLDERLVDDYVPDVEAAVAETLGDPSASEDSSADTQRSSSAIGPGSTGARAPRSSAITRRGGDAPPGKGQPSGDATLVTERAVLEGLRWLARHQRADGSWTSAGLNERCLDGARCADAQAHYPREMDTGLTGLALLAFLGAGHGPESKHEIDDPVTKQRHVLGQIVKRGLLWLVEHQEPDGSFSPERAFLYNEALATMALAEGYGLSRARYFREPAQRAVRFLSDAQRPSPDGSGLWGWRYLSRQDVLRGASSESLDEATRQALYDSDTSVTAWCAMALKSAELAGLEVSRESMLGALAFVRWTTREDGLVGYLDAKGAGQAVSGPHDQFTYHAAGMSALGMCVRIFTQHDPDDPALARGAEQLVKDLPTVSKDRLSVDYYYWYYGSLALNQIDGPDSPRKNGRLWGAWNRAMTSSVLALQNQDEHACGRGGWLVPDRWAHSGGPVYATAINVLTLEVYYRFANAFGGVRRVPTSAK